MDNLKGMAWMTLAMLAFAVTDMILVFATRELPLGQILFLFGIGGAVLFGAWARVQGHRWVTPVLLMRPVMLRNGAEVLATGTFITALSLIPLSTLSAVIQANPLLVTLGAAGSWRKDRLRRRWRRSCGATVGRAGHHPPGGRGFDPQSCSPSPPLIGLSLATSQQMIARPMPSLICAQRTYILLASRAYSSPPWPSRGPGVMPITGGNGKTPRRHGGDHPRQPF